MMEPRRFSQGKYGLKEDPRRRHISFTLANREYLGEIDHVYYDHVTSCARCKVKFFNGELWPIDPPVSQVWVIG